MTFEIAAQAAQAPIQLPVTEGKVLPPDGDTAATGEGKCDDAAMKGEERHHVYSSATAEIPSANTTTSASGAGEADSILLASLASVPLLMVYGQCSALSRALYAGTKVLFCAAMTLGS